MKNLIIGFLFVSILVCFGIYAFVSKENQPNPDAPTRWINPEFSKEKSSEIIVSLIDSNVTCVKNSNNILPLNDLNVKSAFISLGGNSQSFVQRIQEFSDGKFVQIFQTSQINILDSIQADRIVVSLHPTSPDSLNIENWVLDGLRKIPEGKERILIIFGNLPISEARWVSKFDAIVFAPENHPIMQDIVAQKIMGSYGINGLLKRSILEFKAGQGIAISSNGRLKFNSPEQLGMKSQEFERIDQIAKEGIQSGAYPGCQIVVAVKGSIVYQKSFGNYTYDSNSSKVSNHSLYDIASITKIAASTLMTMKLFHEQKIDLDKNLKNYIPEITKETPYGNIVIKEMMAHQAGLEAFIPFYKYTLTDGKPTAPWYQVKKDNVFSLEVAEALYLKGAYKDSMYARILRNPLKEKKYLYSDLCYYFMQPILEKITGESQASYVRNHIYKLMGLRYINYKPLNFYNKSQIVPTEDDQYFRKQLLCGHVHDPGAAMLGGVGGHAGLFSNATDLASIMQLFLNHGKYAGHQFFDDKTISYFTSAPYLGNKRGIGFDRPSASGGGTCDELASQKSFGHSGFTGTLAWADPKNEVVFVFLSNRVHPSQDNWKLRDMGIRTKIQHVVYEIVNARYGK